MVVGTLDSQGRGGFGRITFVGFGTLKGRGVVVLSNQMAVSPPGVGWTILQGMPLIVDPKQNETKTVELTRERFITSTG